MPELRVHAPAPREEPQRLPRTAAAAANATANATAAAATAATRPLLAATDGAAAVGLRRRRLRRVVRRERERVA